MATVTGTIDADVAPVAIPAVSESPRSDSPSTTQRTDLAGLARANSPIATGPVLGPTCLYPSHWTLADLQSHLGDIPAERIRMFPPPGYATEQELVRLQETKEALCELVDGVLVEKAVGAYESQLAMLIAYHLLDYLKSNRIGFVLGESGPVRTIVPQVRMPDVCFVRRSHFADGRFPKKQKVLPIAPDLAIEILSQSNTTKEMERKLDEYFQANTRLVWYIDPEAQTARVYTARDQFVEITGEQTLDGGDLLPGFSIKLADLFAEADGPEGESGS